MATTATAGEISVDGTASKELRESVGKELTRDWARFEKFLPPRLTGDANGRLLEVRLYRTLREYQQALAAQGVAVENPAVYLRDANLILLGFDGDRFDAALQAARQRVDKRRDELKTLNVTFSALQKSEAQCFERENTPERVRDEIQRKRQSDFQKAKAAAAAAERAAEEANRKTYGEATDRLLAAAAHELFHAYVSTRLYPPNVDRLPAWFHEGLAQLVEHGRWRDDKLLIDPPPPELLQALKPGAGKPQELPNLRELLDAEGAGFLRARP
ncbi:MAG: hypothetical protein QM775_00115 [Pirellulales bacterium]